MKAPSTVIFFRDEGFYPVYIHPGETIEQHANLNPGTRRVEDAFGNVLWREKRDLTSPADRVE